MFPVISVYAVTCTNNRQYSALILALKRKKKISVGLRYNNLRCLLKLWNMHLVSFLTGSNFASETCEKKPAAPIGIFVEGAAIQLLFKQNSFTHLGVLLELTDRGIFAQSSLRRWWANSSFAGMTHLMLDMTFDMSFGDGRWRSRREALCRTLYEPRASTVSRRH